MGRNRKTFTDSFKKEVALEALKERSTVNEIAAKYGISASMVSNWKKQFLSGGFSKEGFEVPGRIVTFSTKSGLLGHWKRDLAI